MLFTINRATWRCGDEGVNKHGTGSSLLLNADGFMCCLGQMSSELGCPHAALLRIGTPETIFNVQPSEEVEKLLPKFKGVFLDVEGNDSELTNQAMRINDNIELTHQQREDALIKLFTKYNHEIVFTRRYTDESISSNPII